MKRVGVVKSELQSRAKVKKAAAAKGTDKNVSKTMADRAANRSPDEAGGE